MTLQDAIQCRHSVRRYIDKPLPAQIVTALQDKIAELNQQAHLHIQLICNEPKAFSRKGVFVYGKFSGVSNYFVMAGAKGDDFAERIGYYGEQLVLFAQTLGLNTCWVGLTYSKIPNTYALADDEKIYCYISLGYGETQGVQHKSKTLEQVSNASNDTPAWFNAGVEAALLAPTAVNQQKFYFEYKGENRVATSTAFSLAGYTKIDLGIAKLHFELSAGCEITWE